MPSIQFFVDMKPKGKDRPRFNTHTRRTYTPSETIKAERAISAAAKERMGAAGVLMASDHDAIQATLTFFFAVPQSWSQSKKTKAKNGDWPCIVKPDIDNLIKLVLDGLNGVVYPDDKQIVKLNCDKVYTFDVEGVHINLAWGENINEKEQSPAIAAI